MESKSSVIDFWDEKDNDKVLIHINQTRSSHCAKDRTVWSIRDINCTAHSKQVMTSKSYTRVIRSTAPVVTSSWSRSMRSSAARIGKQPSWEQVARPELQLCCL